MALNKGTRRLLFLLSFALVPMVLIGLGLAYFKLAGFKKALEEAVDARSHGKYKLHLHDAEIHFRKLSFYFDTVYIEHLGPAQAKGIQRIEIPALRLEFGSLLSLLSVQKLEVERLVMQEPQIEINTVPALKKKKDEGLHLAQHIVEMYPLIEGVLDHFDVEFLEIQRASFQLNQPNKPAAFRLGLIDLLVEHWDMEHLSRKSQFQIKVATQGFQLGKSSFRFSGIEYNFREHFLRFNDFQILSKDSVSGSHVEVAGKYLSLNQLNYKNVYAKQRFDLRSMEMEEPSIHVKLKLKKHKTVKHENRDVLTRILQNTFSEGSIDTTFIRNAKLHLVVREDKDSIQIHLPKVDFKVHQFKISQDSNRFQIASMELGLNQTAISLNNKISLACRKIYFDRHRHLTLMDAVLRDSARAKTIASCQRVDLDSFRLLDFVFKKRLYIRGLSLENARLDLDGQHLRLPHKHANAPHKKRQVNVLSVVFRNVSIHYTDSVRTVFVNGINLEGKDIHTEDSGELVYHFPQFRFERLSITPKKKNGLKAEVDALVSDGKMLQAKHVLVHKDSLKVMINKLHAESARSHISEDFYDWKEWKVGEIELKGPLPPVSPSSAPHASGSANHHVKVKLVQFEKLNAHVWQKSREIRLTGKELKAEGFQQSADDWNIASAKGLFQQLTLLTSDAKAEIKELALDYPHVIKATELKAQLHKAEISLAHLELEPVKRGKAWNLTKAVAKHFELRQEGQPLFTSDSLALRNGLWEAKKVPELERVEVYHPIIHLPKAKEKKKDPTPFRLPEYLPKTLVIHPGELSLANEHKIAFGKTEIKARQSSLHCDYIKTELPKMGLLLRGISIEETSTRLDSLVMLENKEWYKDHKLEDDEINATLAHVQIKGIGFQQLEKGSPKDLELEVNKWKADIRRDKRRPDPPYVIKPSTIDGMLKLPKGLISSIQLNSGTLTYHEISDKTQQEGTIVLENTKAKMTLNSMGRWQLKGSTSLYGSGQADLDYETLSDSVFSLDIHAQHVNLSKLDQIVQPLMALRISSGYADDFRLKMTANGSIAVGETEISYHDLHLELMKGDDAKKKTFKTELLSFVADDLVLKHDKTKAKGSIHQSRLKNKSIFNYWVKSISHGSMDAILKGKSEKK